MAIPAQDQRLGTHPRRTAAPRAAVPAARPSAGSRGADIEELRISAKARAGHPAPGRAIPAQDQRPAARRAGGTHRQAFPPGRLLTADRLPPSGMLGLTTLDHREPSERRISGRSWDSIRPTPQPPVHMYPTAKMVPAVVTLTAVSRAGLTLLG